MIKKMILDLSKASVAKYLNFFQTNIGYLCYIQNKFSNLLQIEVKMNDMIIIFHISDFILCSRVICAIVGYRYICIVFFF